MGWNYLSNPKLQRLKFRNGLVISPTLYQACDYLSMLGLKLNHFSKRGHCCVRAHSIAIDLITSKVRYCLWITAEPCLHLGCEYRGMHVWYANSTNQSTCFGGESSAVESSADESSAWQNTRIRTVRHATLCPAGSGFQTPELRRNYRAKYGIVTRRPMRSNAQ